MTTEQQTALAKIKKLLAMKRGGTQHEAETAEALAEAIALKAGIDMASVAVDEHGAPRLDAITHRCFGEWNVRPHEAGYAGIILKCFFNVSCFTNIDYTQKLIVVGTERDLDVAGYVFNFLVREFRWNWNHRHGRSRKRANFMHGVFIGLHSKLRERQPEASNAALVVREESRREEYISKEFGELTSSSNNSKRTGAAVAAGIQAGRQIEIRSGLKSVPKPESRHLPSPPIALLQPANGQLGLL